MKRLSDFMRHLRQTNGGALIVFAWKPQRRFIGEAIVLDWLVADLEARRSAEATDEEPLGLMTHHLYHDEEIWSFLDSLLKVIKEHETVRIMEPPAVFWEAGVTSALAPERAGTTA